MLANHANESAQIGRLSDDVHMPFTFLHELIDFVHGQLAVWRDRKDRKQETAETVLTSQLCAHLNSAARRTEGWDVLQFRVEEPDEVMKGRKVDLVPAPSDATVWIEGRKHVDFDSLLPIECKRLPTPKSKERDEREYVFSNLGSVGGIQRFKAGNHGSGHRIGAMIAYVQEDASPFWLSRISEWISELVGSKQAGWTSADALVLERHDTASKVTLLKSVHTRDKGLPPIELRHLWVKMN